jgi:pseudouridylate synthase
MPDNHLILSEEVARALQNGEPLVALESTIISHGMPFPQNMETALNVEKIVRDHGAVPATIAVIDGKLKAGLSEAEIQQLGKLGAAAVKTSRRDMAFVVAKKATGATTVAATIMIAAMAGIRIFATGGIGGVHRGAESSMDISADLQELAQTRVAVVCAGAKSILDLGLTLEYLETCGVPVVGYRTEEFPAFFSRKSGLTLQLSADSPAELAKLLKTQEELNLKSGIVIANPIPEAFEMEYAAINQAIEKALEEAVAKNITGKAITPFLLSRIEQLTAGKSLEANIQLVYNNARLAAEVAVAHSSRTLGNC